MEIQAAWFQAGTLLASSRADLWIAKDIFSLQVLQAL
jgi:hypothetical protein